MITISALRVAGAAPRDPKFLHRVHAPAAAEFEMPVPYAFYAVEELGFRHFPSSDSALPARVAPRTLFEGDALWLPPQRIGRGEGA